MFNSNNSTESHLYTDSSNTNDSIGLTQSDNYLTNKRSVTIPKIIMQTWKDHNIPDKWKCSPESIKEHMPDWKYVLMTDEDNRNFVKKHFPDFLKYYDRFPHNIQRVDAVRYCWLYVHGGIYMDLDFEMMHPLDEFFTNDVDVYLVSSSNVGSYLTNSFMASKPGCKLWLEVIEAMKRPNLPWYYIGKHVNVMSVTGPVMLTHVVKKTTVVYGTLPSKLILPCSVCNINCSAKGAYLKQLEGSSWIAYDTKIYNFFMCKWKTILCALVIILLILIVLVIFLLKY